MRIKRVHIHNFRNFELLDVELGSQVVVLGENSIGKTNFLNALRLLLDPSLPDSSRQLRETDFWDGLARPLTNDASIEIFIDLADFEEDEDLLALLAEHLVECEPMVARLSYIFRPLPGLPDGPQKDDDYEFLIYGGGRESNRVGFDLRRRIPLEILQALRDAEGDLAVWSRSPLRSLIEKAASTMDREELKGIGDAVSISAQALAQTEQISHLSEQIRNRLTNMVGPEYDLDPKLALLPTDAYRLIRSLRLLIDGERRGIGEASLGCANLLLLALKALELEQLAIDGGRDHTFLAIEEPEAHLHPHIQRLVYRDFLRTRTDAQEPDDEKHAKIEPRTTILTTHSPHIASVAPLDSIVLLRRSEDGSSTQAVSAASLDFEAYEIADLERYLDVNRGEMLFAKGVILVEGDSERFIVPALANLIGYDLDRHGISVCSVSGTNFSPYVKLLSTEGLNIPFAVLTDFDPNDKPKSGLSIGQSRVISLMEDILPEGEIDLGDDELLNKAPAYGIFLNQHTLEIDLFQCGRHKSMCSTLVELCSNKKAKERAEFWKKDPDNLDKEQFLKDIEDIGKGRFAQRQASRMTGKACPEYIKKGIKYVAGRCA